VLLKIDLQGARQVRAAMPDALLVFLAPPSPEELKRRLIGRGTEDEETIRRRLRHADEELAAEPEFDVTVVNDFVERAADELVSLLGSPLLTPAQHRHR
jgi:guanylate kinase